MPCARLLHVICHYYGQWLPGDPRGWRSRDHKTHSSGDYKNPPPADEHRGLYTSVKLAMKRDVVTLGMCDQKSVGNAILEKLRAIEVQVHCLSCGPTHVHGLYESCADDAVKEIGRAKQFASLRLKNQPGKIWAKARRSSKFEMRIMQRTCAGT